MRRPLLALLVLAVAAFAAITGNATVLTALPVVAVFALLLGGAFLGEDAYVRRLRGTRPTPRRAVPGAPVVRSRRLAQRGGAAVMGRCRARRGPPRPLVAV